MTSNQALPPQQYENYMASPEWAAVRAKWYLRHGRWCRKCLTRANLHLHHMTYVRLGCELDTDLVALCHGCHDRLHASHEQGQSLLVTTTKFLGSAPHWMLTAPEGPKKKKKKKKRQPPTNPKLRRKKKFEAFHREASKLGTISSDGKRRRVSKAN